MMNILQSKCGTIDLFPYKYLDAHLLAHYDVSDLNNDELRENPVVPNKVKSEQYAVDFTELYTGNGVRSGRVINGTAQRGYSTLSDDVPSYRISIQGITGNSNLNVIEFYYRNSSGEEKYMRFYDDGVYTIPMCYHVPDSTSGTNTGFVLLYKDDTNRNCTIEQLPVDTNLILNNFTFEENNGIGSRIFFTDAFEVYQGRCTLIKEKDKLTLQNIIASNSIVLVQNVGTNKDKGYIDGGTAKVRVTGIPDGGYIYIGPSEINTRIYNDGTHIIPLKNDNNGFAIIGCNSNCIGSTITFEVIPDYPNSLVFNGTSPIYPINRTIATNPAYSEWESYNKLLIKQIGATICNYTSKQEQGEVGQSLTVNIPSYRIKVSGLIGNQYLYINRSISTNSGNSVIKWNNYTINGNGEHVIPELKIIESPETEDDFVKILYNQLYVVQDSIMDWSNTSNWVHHQNRAVFTITRYKIHITKKLDNLSDFIGTTIISKAIPCRVRIQGINTLPPNKKLHYFIQNVGSIVFNTDGVYDLPYCEYETRYNMDWGILGGGEFDCDITIEQLNGCPANITVECLPTYSDEKASSLNDAVAQNITGVKAMVMDVTPLDNSSVIYSQNSGVERDFSIFTAGNIAYGANNINDTYINGEINNGKTVYDLRGEPQIIAVNTQNAGGYPLLSNQGINRANMAFRKLMLFDRNLSEDEIKYLTNKMQSDWTEEDKNRLSPTNAVSLMSEAMVGTMSMDEITNEEYESLDDDNMEVIYAVPVPEEELLEEEEELNINDYSYDQWES